MKKMKGILLLLFFVFGVIDNYAQTKLEISDRIEEEKIEYMLDDSKPMLKNWFVTASGGPQMYLGDHDKQCKVKDRISGNFDVSIAKWITPVFGVRMMYSGLTMRGATKWEAPAKGYDAAYGTGKDIPGKGKGNPRYNLQGQKFRFGNLDVLVMFNLCALVNGYDDSRFYNCIPYLGVGFAASYDDPGVKTRLKSAREASANAGVLNTFRINKHLDAVLDIHAMYVNDRFDGEGGGRFGEGLWTASVGVAYKFKRRGFERNKLVTRTVTNNIVESLGLMFDSKGHLVEGEVEGGRKLTAEDVLEMRRRMDELMTNNDRMEKELSEMNNDSVIKRKSIVADNLVVFEIGKSKLSNEARVNLGMFADMIKVCDPNVVYTISGYADKGTGNEEINNRLSVERAQAVYDCLTKEFGVNPKQLKVISNGGVGNMFYNDPRLSRAVINRAEQ